MRYIIKNIKTNRYKFMLQGNIHLNIKPVRRSLGENIISRVAYQTASSIKNPRTGIRYNYSRKKHELYGTFLITPQGATTHYENYTKFWANVEAHHKRKDAIPGRVFSLALPAELDRLTQIKLAYDFASYISRKYGVGVQVSFHKLESKNPHCHISISSCSVSEDGKLGRKVRELDPIAMKHTNPTATTVAEELRKIWADMINAAYARAGVMERVDHRSYARRGLNREPMVHEGMYRYSSSALISDPVALNATINKHNEVIYGNGQQANVGNGIKQFGSENTWANDKYSSGDCKHENGDEFNENNIQQDYSGCPDTHGGVRDEFRTAQSVRCPHRNAQHRGSAEEYQRNVAKIGIVDSDGCAAEEAYGVKKTRLQEIIATNEAYSAAQTSVALMPQITMTATGLSQIINKKTTSVIHDLFSSGLLENINNLIHIRIENLYTSAVNQYTRQLELLHNVSYIELRNQSISKCVNTSINSLLRVTQLEFNNLNQTINCYVDFKTSTQRLLVALLGNYLSKKALKSIPHVDMKKNQLPKIVTEGTSAFIQEQSRINLLNRTSLYISSRIKNTLSVVIDEYASSVYLLHDVPIVTLNSNSILKHVSTSLDEINKDIHPKLCELNHVVNRHEEYRASSERLLLFLLKYYLYKNTLNFIPYIDVTKDQIQKIISEGTSIYIQDASYANLINMTNDYINKIIKKKLSVSEDEFIYKAASLHDVPIVTLNDNSITKCASTLLKSIISVTQLELNKLNHTVKHYNDFKKSTQRLLEARRAYSSSQNALKNIPSTGMETARLPQIITQSATSHINRRTTPDFISMMHTYLYNNCAKAQILAAEKYTNSISVLQSTPNILMHDTPTSSQTQSFFDNLIIKNLYRTLNQLTNACQQLENIINKTLNEQHESDKTNIIQSPQISSTTKRPLSERIWSRIQKQLPCMDKSLTLPQKLVQILRDIQIKYPKISEKHINKAIYLHENLSENEKIYLITRFMHEFKKDTLSRNINYTTHQNKEQIRQDIINENPCLDNHDVGDFGKENINEDVSEEESEYTSMSFRR